MGSTVLDRANWSSIQFGIGIPNGDTPGNVYVNSTAVSGGLYIKKTTIWEELVGGGGLTATSPSIEDGLSKFDSASANNLETCYLREIRDETGPDYYTTLQITDSYAQEQWYDIATLVSQEGGEGPPQHYLRIGDVDKNLNIRGYSNLTYTNQTDTYEVLTEGTFGGWSISAGTFSAGNDSLSVTNFISSGTYAAGISFHVGSRDPTGSINHPEGDIYFREDDADSNVYLKTGATSSGWVSLRLPDTIVQVAVFSDDKASAAGGSSTAETYHTRDITDTDYNNIDGLSFSSDQITFPAGYFLVEVIAPHYNNSGSDSVHFIECYNITDDTFVRGQNHICPTAQEQYATLTCLAGFGDTYEIRHWIGQTQATDGLGRRTDNLQNRPGSDNRYTVIKITKIY